MPVSSLLQPLQNLLNTFQSERHYRDERKDAALAAINTALIETKKYVEDSAGRKSFDRNREYQLAALWADAAAKSRYASAGIAERLHEKSVYWSDQFEWSTEEVVKKQIDFDAIHQAVRDLIRNQ